MSIDYGRSFHQGVCVANIADAMVELSEALGVGWCARQERDQPIWMPDVGPTTVPLKFTYSSGDGQHIELLEGSPGSIWDGSAHPGLHHVGIWSDDLRGEAEALIAAGWTLRVAHVAPDDGYGAFCYLQPPCGLIVELVSTVLKPAFSAWFAGGQLALSGGS